MQVGRHLVLRDGSLLEELPIAAAGGILPIPCISALVRLAQPGIEEVKDVLKVATDYFLRIMADRHDLKGITMMPPARRTTHPRTEALYRDPCNQTADITGLPVYFAPMLNGLAAQQAEEVGNRFEPMAPIDLIAGLTLLLTDPTLFGLDGPALICAGTIWDHNGTVLHPSLRRTKSGTLYLGVVPHDVRDPSGEQFAHAFLLGGERQVPMLEPST